MTWLLVMGWWWGNLTAGVMFLLSGCHARKNPLLTNPNFPFNSLPLDPFPISHQSYKVGYCGNWSAISHLIIFLQNKMLYIMICPPPPPDACLSRTLKTRQHILTWLRTQTHRSPVYSQPVEVPPVRTNTTELQSQHADVFLFFFLAWLCWMRHLRLTPRSLPWCRYLINSAVHAPASRVSWWRLVFLAKYL